MANAAPIASSASTSTYPTSADGFLDIPQPPHRTRRSASESSASALGARVRRSLRNFNAIAIPRVPASIRRSLSTRSRSRNGGSISEGGGESRSDMNDGSMGYAIRGEQVPLVFKLPPPIASAGQPARRRTISLGSDLSTGQDVSWSWVSLTFRFRTIDVGRDKALADRSIGLATWNTHDEGFRKEEENHHAQTRPG